MKLIEILVRELSNPSIGGWPSDTGSIEQGASGRLFDPEKPSRPYLFDERTFEAAEDFQDASVTREEYEAALAASKEMLVNKPVEWDGLGLPPVGAAFEYGSHHSPARCIAIGAEYVFAARGEPGTENYEEWLIDKSTSFFPTSTERERFIKSCLEEDVLGSHKLFRATAGALYDSIAEGRLPGVKLEAPDA